MAYNYYGVSGWTELGDRKALNVDFFAVKDVEDKPSWVKLFEYDAATGSLSETSSK